MLTEYCELLTVMHFPLFFVCFTVKNDSFCCLVVVLSHGVFLATVVISTSAFDKREILNRKTPRVKEYLWTGPTPLPSLTPKSRPRDFTHFFLSKYPFMTYYKFNAQNCQKQTQHSL